MLRIHLPALTFSKDDAHIVTVDQVSKGLEKAARSGLPPSADPRQRFFWVHNYSPLVSVETMFVPVGLLDSIKMKDGRKIQVKPEDLIGQDHLLAALALPKVGPGNLQALWSSALKESIDSPLSEYDEALQMSSNSSPNGFAISTLLVTGQEGSTTEMFPLHVLRDTRKDQTLLVGEAAPEFLVEFLKEAKIVFHQK